MPEPAMPAEEMIAAQMRLLRVRYLEAMKVQIVSLQNALAACETHCLSPEARAELKHIAHKLAGTGKTYGFPELSVVARRLDDQVIDDPATDMTVLALMTRPVLAACLAAQRQAEPAEAPPAIQPQALSQTRSAPEPARAAFGRRNPTAEPAPIASVKAAARKPLILVADDDDAIRGLFGSLFADEARVVFATNSDEALAMMRRFPPDLVLLDDIMPGAITGLRLLENLKATRELVHIPVVMITASDGEEHIERGLNAGAVGYITKPFDATAVARWIRNLLDGLPSSPPL